MRILYYDCPAGISGDMHLAALVDLGLPEDHLRGELAKLGVGGWRLRLTADSKNGIGGTRADVDLGSRGRFRAQVPPERLVEPSGSGTSHEHRTYRDIQALIDRSSLSAGVKARSLAIFERLARAEAKVHSMPVAEVAFHEVGAVDSIVDIVGAAIGIEWFQPDLILASPPELGGGTVWCAHGRLPVPAPATVEILLGIPVRTGAVPFEMTTPTGAAILASQVDRFTSSESLVIRKVGYGVGHRTVDIPNLLRVYWAEDGQPSSGPSADPWEETSPAVVLECNLDDMTPEALGGVLESLLEAGASDVWHTPIVMKKSRPAVLLSVLCPPDRAQALAEQVFRQTSTLGIRRAAVEKLVLKRELQSLATRWGEIRVKTAWLGGQMVKAKPEFEDCRRIAAEQGLPLKDVMTILQGEIDARRTDR